MLAGLEGRQVAAEVVGVAGGVQSAGEQVLAQRGVGGELGGGQQAGQHQVAGLGQLGGPVRARRRPRHLFAVGHRVNTTVVAGRIGSVHHTTFVVTGPVCSRFSTPPK